MLGKRVRQKTNDLKLHILAAENFSAFSVLFLRPENSQWQHRQKITTNMCLLLLINQGFYKIFLPWCRKVFILTGSPSHSDSQRRQKRLFTSTSISFSSGLAVGNVRPKLFHSFAINFRKYIFFLYCVIYFIIL